MLLFSTLNNISTCLIAL